MSNTNEDYNTNDEHSPTNQPPMNNRPPIHNESRHSNRPVTYKASFSDYLVEQELIVALTKGVEESDALDLAASLGVLPYHIDWAIGEIVHLEMEHLEHAFDLLENEGFRPCVQYLTNKFLSEQLEHFDNENQ